MKTKVLPIINHEQLFQSLDSAYIVFGTDDPTFTILEENQAHAGVAMVKREDVIGKPLFDVFPDTSNEYMQTGVSSLLESIRQVIKTGTVDVLPMLKYDLKDQAGVLKTKYWSVSHHPLFDKAGKVSAVYQATEDITEKVMTEQKLDITQAQLKQTLSNSFIGTWYWDLKNHKIYADDNLAAMFGVSSDDAKNGLPLKVFLNSIHPMDRDRVTQEIEEVIRSEGGFESEYRTFNSGGDVRWVIVRGNIEVGVNGEPEKFPGVIVDITERKTAENHFKFLAAANTQFSASLSPAVTLNAIAKMVVPDIADWCAIDLYDGKRIERVVTVHKDPEKIKWAEQLYKKQGSPDIDDTTGVPVALRTREVVYYPEVTDDVLVAAAKDEEELELLREIGMISAIVVPMMLDGEPIGTITLVTSESKVHYKAADIEMAKGLANRAALAVHNANLFQSVQREIKERRLLQQKLEMSNDALESRVAERTRQLVDTNDGLEKEIYRRQKTERELQRYSKDLARSNQELQDFAYVASHDLQEPLRKIQAFGDLLESEYREQIGDGAEYLSRMRNAASRMSTLIQDLLAFSRVATQPQNIVQVELNVVLKGVISDLEASIADKGGKVTVEKLPAVWADATHMRQLFQNLIGNALKFHKPDVPPIVAVSVLPRSRTDKYYEIHITDNGIGFDEKYLDRIFSVFQRLHGKDTYGGTGIGLAVCRKIVERYSGKIEAKSTTGRGSTFIIKLPIKRKEQPHDYQ